jgi:hypothetical protein
MTNYIPSRNQQKKNSANLWGNYDETYDEIYDETYDAIYFKMFSSHERLLGPRIPT